MPTTSNDWTGTFDLPSRFFGADGPFGLFGADDYELYEEDGEFVLTVEMPGFDPADIDATWHDGRLTIAAETVDEDRGRERTYHRSFRFPKAVAEDALSASYNNGVLEVRLPVAETSDKGTAIPIEA
ncbi:Hsp20/alpha crystallin family protein [Halosegnis sp.]|uniref:Hsp20/alpha crystallin family protein n=1 Tax=Halosegnis sp. TaxID=2864959 RepID=UPI0035D457DA